MARRRRGTLNVRLYVTPPITFPRAKDRSEVNLCVIPVTFKGGKFVTKDPAESFVCAPGWKLK